MSVFTEEQRALILAELREGGDAIILGAFETFATELDDAYEDELECAANKVVLIKYKVLDEKATESVADLQLQLFAIRRRKNVVRGIFETMRDNAPLTSAVLRDLADLIDEDMNELAAGMTSEKPRSN